MMVMMGRVRVDGVMMVMMMMVRTSDSSLLWRAGVGREAERMEGSGSGMRHLLFWQAMMVMVVTRGSCQYQHGRSRRVRENLTDVHGRGGGGDVREDEPSLVVCYPSDWRSEYSCRPHYRYPLEYLPST